ncbi:MAG TPA: hypothetical protein VE173_16800, partial [Longimicrobiales bacterium]|nr:hypothetical protein [Longimicrobiales bacterium]
QLLRARLIDMLVGDWDRHADQWRWASYSDGQLTRWEPIPRDRDFALCRIDGVLPWLAGVYRPSYVGFGPEPPDPLAMHWSSQRLDRGLLNGLERADFVAAARDLQSAFSDEVIDRAVDVLPASYRRAVGEELRRDLRLRRDSLVEVAEGFYELLAQWVDVHGTEEVDSVALTPAEDGVRVTMWAPREGDFVRYDRVFHPSETKDIRIYLWEGDDRVVVDGPVVVPVRFVTGEGDDRVVDRSHGDNLRVYDDQGDNDLRLGPEAFVTGSEYLRQDSLRTAYLSWQVRDWGSAWVPRPEVWYHSDIGPYVGFGLARYGYGFGQEPHESKLSMSVLNGLDPGQWILNLEADRALGDRGWRAVGKAEARTD